MPDRHFADPRLAALYDPLDPDRSDLVVYAAIAEELEARRVLDIGCGTGTFAVMLAGRGVDVVGVDPAAASLDVARAKPGADRVRWIHGDATSLPPLQVDLTTMTANVAQAITDAADWQGTLRGAFAALRPRGHVVLETRDPARRAWEHWNRTESLRQTDVARVGRVTTWHDLVVVDGPLVTFRSTFVLPDGERLTSDSALRFRQLDEVAEDLRTNGFVVDEVRDAPDRPGLELVVVAHRPA